MKTVRILAFALVLISGLAALALRPLFTASAHPAISTVTSTSTPTATPTSTPTATPTSTPTATPTSTPTTTPSTISMALVFDNNVPSDQLDADEASENVGYDYGASAPEQVGGTVRHDLYLPWAQGWCPGVGIYGRCPNGGPPSLQWLKEYHPTWILWQTSKHGVPTVPAHSKANPGPIVDFTNPAVQQYWMNSYIAPGLTAGYNGIAVDGPLSFDAYGAVGHYNAQHHFIKQYTGKYVDKSWAKAQTKALGAFLKLARAIKPSTKIALDQFLDCSVKETLWALPFSHTADTIVDEEGYTNWGSARNPWTTTKPGPFCSDSWLLKTETYIRVQKGGEHLLLIDAVPYSVTQDMTDTDMTARASLQWSLANYLLVKYSHTYFWFGQYQHYGSPIALQHEELADLGKALGDMKSSQHVYMRLFSKGMAIVNPSPTKSFTVKLQTGMYSNLYGKNLKKVKVLRHSGIVLVKR